MITLEDALDECLAQIATGQATIEECLARYPQHAPQLRRLLAAAAPLQPAPTVKPSASFKARNRAQLIAHIGEHPRRRSAPLPFSQNSLRLAFSVASLVVAFFLVGTVAAQSALPGQPLYSWKRTSENAWRAIAPNPLAVDLGLTQRRADELVQMSGSEGEPVALQGYREALVQVGTYTDPTEKEAIANSLTDQKLELTNNGLTVPELEQLLSNLRTPTIEATLEPTTLVVTLSPTVEPSQTPLPSDTASPVATATPSATATSQPPTQTSTPVVPTVAVPTQSSSVPTLEIPTAIATVLPPELGTVLPDIATAIASPIGDVGDLISTIVPDLNLTLPFP